MGPDRCAFDRDAVAEIQGCAGILVCVWIEVDRANSGEESPLWLSRITQGSGSDGSRYRDAHARYWRHHGHLHGGLRHFARALALSRT